MPTRLSRALPPWLRALALLLLVALPLNAAELNNSSTGQWSESDSSNTSASPDGWPIGLAPNQVRGVGQSMMGALKRFWDRINPTVTTTGSANAYVYTPSNASFPTAYVSGECYSFKASFANTTAATLNINTMGAKNLFKQTPAGPAALIGGEIQINQMVTACYDGTQLQITSYLASPATAGSSLNLIGCQTASTSASLAFTTGISSTYEIYKILGSGVLPVTDSVELWLRVSEDGGSTWKSGAAAYNTHRTTINSANAATTAGSNDTKILVGNGISNNAARGISFELNLAQPASTTRNKMFFGSVLQQSSDTNFYGSSFFGEYTGDTAAINGLQFSLSSGNISVGKICLYGVSTSWLERWEDDWSGARGAIAANDNPATVRRAA